MCCSIDNAVFVVLFKILHFRRISVCQLPGAILPGTGDNGNVLLISSDSRSIPNSPARPSPLSLIKVSSLTSDLKITDWDEPSWSCHSLFYAAWLADWLTAWLGFYLKCEMWWDRATGGELWPLPGWPLTTWPQSGTPSAPSETKYLLGPPCQFSLSTGHGLRGLKVFKNWNLAENLMRNCEEFEQENWDNFSNYK